MIPIAFYRIQTLVVLCAAMLVFSLQVGDAHAQAASCTSLEASLRTLERNGEFQEAERNGRAARRLQSDLQDAESAYVRTGCNDRARRGETLTGNCRALARQITTGRSEATQLNDRVQTGNAISQQREAILQEISRFGCGRGDSRATVNGGQRGGNLFDQLFGGYTRESDQFYNDELVEEGADQFGSAGQSTVRTVCVRTCDGYFWPVSYSTVPDFAGNDAEQCQAQCPGTEVRLFSYANPGQEPEQMVDLLGQPYSALPNAFRYRKEFDQSCSCKASTTTAELTTLAGGGNYGQSPAAIDVNGAAIPLPVRDPRSGPAVPAPTEAAVAVVQPQAPVQTAEAAIVPLPRRRPSASGEAAVEQPVPVATAENQRVVQFGDKRVRIVGPDTPYAQPVEAVP